MNDIEIPIRDKNRPRHYRFFEMLPGLTTWTILLMPFVLGILKPILTVYLLVAYLLIWFMKGVSMNLRVLQGWKTMQTHMKLPWEHLLSELETGKINGHAKRPKWHYANLKRLSANPSPIIPSKIVHVMMIATYNEHRDVLEPTVQSLLASDYNMKKVILVFAYEERGGAAIKQTVTDLAVEYGSKFRDVLVVEHPDKLPGEVIGKGPNITFAGRKVQQYLVEHKIDPLNVLVTTLDSDNRPHKSYLGALSYTYAVSPDPIHTSYQPIPLFTQNIWDAPAPMRVIATGNSFWMLVSCMRSHSLRNFSAHAQPMQALLETDFWSVRTIVEDGHQFWRSYFKFDGKHEVFPIFVPIYQDAVFAGGYIKTLRAQFIQLRRWAWGCTDVAYVVHMGFYRKNNISKFKLIAKFWRLFEGHVSWATAPLLILGAAFIPAFLNPNSYAATQLPITASRIESLALVGIWVTFFLSFKALPPKPARYKHHRTVFMVLQWVLLPVTTVLYNGLSGLNAQTRLLTGFYLGKFDVTEKAVAKDKPPK
jgi:cellulose synthase/poly-beta-1,6-N-acetylglucosamine synthase-like glycosyltransferase